MPTTATFSTAALTDAVSKAAKVAPTKGAGFDKAAGVLISVMPNGAIVMSNNLDVTYRQIVSDVELQGDPKQWRVPSGLFARLLSSLPQHEASTVKLVDRGDDALRLQCGTVTARFALMDHKTFPFVMEQDMTGAATANHFASKAEQVSWATADDATVLAGVHISGDALYATDRYCMASIPCTVTVEHPVTVPLKTIAPLLRQASDVKIKAFDKKLGISLDAETQITTTLILGEYPTSQIKAMIDRPYPNVMTLNRTFLVDTLDRIIIVVSEKEPTVTLSYETGTIVNELILDLEGSSGGRIRDKISVRTDMTKPFSFTINPEYPLMAARAARLDDLQLLLPETPDGTSAIFMSDESGYKCLLMPKVVKS